jgi:hypothetical protein
VVEPGETVPPPPELAEVVLAGAAEVEVQVGEAAGAEVHTSEVAAAEDCAGADEEAAAEAETEAAWELAACDCDWDRV